MARDFNRRQFLERSKRTGLGLAVGMTILANPRSVRAAPAGDKIVMAIAGCPTPTSNKAIAAR